MTSAIDSTKPTALAPLTADVRSNFAIAASEITALQAGTVPGLAASTGSGLVGFIQSGTGAVAETVQTELRSRAVNAKTQFGAVGDGVTDDTTAIANWLVAATGRAGYLPSGTYITSNFTIPNSTHIFGDGARVTTLKMKASTNSNLVAATAGSWVVIEGITLDGNNANNTSGRCISFITDPAADGPALVLRDVVITNGPLGGGDNSSAFFSGLAWMVFQNVRYVNNKGTLWLSTNDSLFEGLYVGNSGVVAAVPSVIVGAGDNAFIRCYFGGNGANTSTAAPQVQLLGASYNTFIGCTNDSANGNGYQLNDSGGVFSQYNQWIGGQTTNPSQNVTNVSYHFFFSDTSKFNIVKGHILHNTLTKKGKFGIAEAVSGGSNLIQGCQMGTFGTQALATIGTGGTRVLDCVGLTPQGTVAITVTASPFTYTNNDNVREAVYINGGTVSAISKNGNQIFSGTNATAWLEPLEAVTVTYTVAPSMWADRK